ncbi:MAG: hypothetical protein H7138_01105 [Myxococcales bacterium]|nr:hypothetical protein [Myxococcales bacterium]
MRLGAIQRGDLARLQGLGIGRVVHAHTIALHKGQPVSGRVIDDAGKPVWQVAAMRRSLKA